MNATARRIRTTLIATLTAAAAVVGINAGTGLGGGEAQAATRSHTAHPGSQGSQGSHGSHGSHDRVPRMAVAWADAWNSGDPQRMAALFTEGGVYQDNAFQVSMSGHEGVATWIAITEQSVADAHVHLVDAIQQGDEIAVRWEFSGTDTGAFAKDRPATGKSFTVPATTIIDLKGNKIRHVTDYYNLADLLRQVGLPAGAWTPPAR